MASGKRKKRTGIAWRASARGAAFSIAALLLSVLLLTLLVWLGWLPESSIGVGNTVIRILSAIVGGAAASAGRRPGTWLAGGFAALAGLLFSTAVMGAYLGSFSFSWNLAADLLMSFAIGSAVTALLLRRKQA